MSVDREYRIKITTEADNTGTAQTTQELKNLKGAVEEAGQQTDFLNFKKSELKKLAVDLTRAFPELGQAMRYALDPRIAGISLLIWSFRKLNEMMEATINVLTPSDWRGAAQAIEANKRALDDAAIAAKGYWEELHRAKTETSGIVEDTEKLVDAIHRQSTAQAEVRNAKMGVDLARVDAAEKSGQISQTEAARHRLRIKDFYAGEETKAKNLQDAKEYNAMISERQKLVFRISQLESEVPGKQKAAGDEQARVVKLTAEREMLVSNIAESDKKIADYQKELDSRSVDSIRSAVFDYLTEDYIEQSKASEEEARAAAANRLRKIDSGRVEREAHAASVKRDAVIAEQELTTARSKAEELGGNINTRYQTKPEQIRNREEVAKLESQQRALTAAGETAQVISKLDSEKAELISRAASQVEAESKGSSAARAKADEAFLKALATVTQQQREAKHYSEELAQRIGNIR